MLYNFCKTYVNATAVPRTVSEKLPIRTIASLTGVNPITLRAWERRYGLIRPARTSKGHRLYTHDHVEQIRELRRLGMSVSDIAHELNAAGVPTPTGRGRGHPPGVARALSWVRT